MSSVGTVTVEVVGDFSSFHASLDRARARLEEFYEMWDSAASLAAFIADGGDPWEVVSQERAMFGEPIIPAVPLLN